MAKAFKCDICGGLYEPYIGTKIKFKDDYDMEFNCITFSCNRAIFPLHHEVDCCPDCAKAITKAIEERKGSQHVCTDD